MDKGIVVNILTEEGQVSKNHCGLWLWEGGHISIRVYGLAVTPFTLRREDEGGENFTRLLPPHRKHSVQKALGRTVQCSPGYSAHCAGYCFADFNVQTQEFILSQLPSSKLPTLVSNQK